MIDAGRRRRREAIRSVVYHAGVAGLGFVMLYPILWLFASSLKGPSEIWTNVTSLVPRQLTPQNYVNGWAGFGGITFPLGDRTCEGNLLDLENGNECADL